MDVQPTNAHKMLDHELNKALDAQSPEDRDGLSIQYQRLAKVQEYEEAALARSNPFAAIIGMGNAHFQRVFEHLGAALLDELDARPNTIAEIREVEPEIRLLLKVRSAMETDLEVGAAEFNQQAVAFPSAVQRKALEAKCATSKRDHPSRHWAGRD